MDARAYMTDLSPIPMLLHRLRAPLAIAAVVLAFGWHTATAQQPRFMVLRDSISDIDYYASNYGIFGLNVARNSQGFSYPRVNGKSYLFGSGLWFGTRKRYQDTLTTLVFSTYNPNSGASWATPGEYRDTTNPAPLYNSLEHDPTSGAWIVGSSPMPKTTWPLWLAPGSKYRAYPFALGTFEPDASPAIATALRRLWARGPSRWLRDSTTVI